MGRFPALVALLVIFSGCGGSGLEGTLRWSGQPVVSGQSLDGRVANATSHSVTLDPKAMRLLDANGRKVAARFTLSREQIAKGAEADLHAAWKSGKPVRIDYGSGTLALPSH